MSKRIGIAGAGLLGRLLAWRLSRAGHAVCVFDPAAGPAPTFDGRQPAGFSAAGMLSPLAELDNSSVDVASLGWRSIDRWRGITAELAGRPAFSVRGSLLLAHRGDAGAARRVLARLAAAPQPMPRAEELSATQLAELEPALQPTANSWLLPGEGQIDAVATLQALFAEAPDVSWHWQRPVQQLRAGELRLADGSARRFDVVFDVRGTGARPELPVRGVRGEMVWLDAPRHGLTRPLRLLHPRHRIYLVPRSADTLLVGASEIESEDRSPMSLRSAVELMSAAHSVMPALAEARIARLDVNLRPALPDNEPLSSVEPGLVRINGLFRHGWLLAPALVDDVLRACELQLDIPVPETA
ncbi:FAD-dependent oxidoreductase [Piscinibacter sakaiensis]|uniref:FAD-dependent oxidoreductase n=1 Tax=Piscinibacter sakaiensis TaxID=1547922 RepID=UPI003AAF6037